MKRIALGAEQENLDRMIRFIEESAREAGAPKPLLHEILLACEEVLVNIIRYAYPQGKGEVEIVSRPPERPRLFIVEISDSGVAFDPLSWPEPDLTLPLEKRPLGGLGIFLMRKIMDSVEYQRREGRNVLTLVKKQGLT